MSCGVVIHNCYIASCSCPRFVRLLHGIICTFCSCSCSAHLDPMTSGSMPPTFWLVWTASSLRERSFVVTLVEQAALRFKQRQAVGEQDTWRQTCSNHWLHVCMTGLCKTVAECRPDLHSTRMWLDTTNRANKRAQATTLLGVLTHYLHHFLSATILVQIGGRKCSQA